MAGMLWADADHVWCSTAQGCDEAEETLAFIQVSLNSVYFTAGLTPLDRPQSASQSYTSLAQSLSTSPPPQTHPTTSTAASSLHTLTEALFAQGDVYRSTALALDRSVAAPLGRWSKAHRVRVGDAREYFVGLGARGRGHGEQGTVIGEYEADVLGVAKVGAARRGNRGALGLTAWATAQAGISCQGADSR